MALLGAGGAAAKTVVVVSRQLVFLDAQAGGVSGLLRQLHACLLRDRREAREALLDPPTPPEAAAWRPPAAVAAASWQLPPRPVRASAPRRLPAVVLANRWSHFQDSDDEDGEQAERPCDLPPVLPAPLPLPGGRGQGPGRAAAARAGAAPRTAPAPRGAQLPEQAEPVEPVEAPRAGAGELEAGIAELTEEVSRLTWAAAGSEGAAPAVPPMAAAGGHGGPSRQDLCAAGELGPVAGPQGLPSAGGADGQADFEAVGFGIVSDPIPECSYDSLFNALYASVVQPWTVIDVDRATCQVTECNGYVEREMTMTATGERVLERVTVDEEIAEVAFTQCDGRGWPYEVEHVFAIHTPLRLEFYERHVSGGIRLDSQLSAGAARCTLENIIEMAMRMEEAQDVLAEARADGLDSQLQNLAARPEAIASGRSWRELLGALRASRGLVNVAKRMLTPAGRGAQLG